MHLFNVTQAQLNSLPPLRVPRRLVIKRSEEQREGEEKQGGGQSENQTDQEKNVLKRTAALIEVVSLSLSLSLSLSPFSCSPSTLY